MKDKINILFLTVQLETIGGSERLIYQLASNLDRALFNPSVAWLSGDKVLKEFTALGIPLLHLPKIKRFDISTMQHIKDVVKHNDIHIVNAHHFMPMLYSYYACKVANHIKLLYTEHSQWEIRQIPWKWEKIGSHMLSKSEGAIGVNSEVSREIQNKFQMKAEKIFTILNGVDIKSFQVKRDKARLKTALGLSKDDIAIGIVANFRKVKNHIFLLHAFNELCKAYKNIKILIVGEGYVDDAENSEMELMTFIKENELSRHVLLLGYRTDIPEILSILDIFCLTSFKEGLPISLIEAMASGLPVVGTDVEGLRDVIVHGRNGYLVKIGDVEGLKNTLKTLIQDKMLRQKFGGESKKLVAEHYSLQRCINQYQDLFFSTMYK
jgi:glycosyltransferase involved in cell wall biosynthesis